jgi:hypothetical protein
VEQFIVFALLGAMFVVSGVGVVLSRYAKSLQYRDWETRTRKLFQRATESIEMLRLLHSRGFLNQKEPEVESVLRSYGSLTQVRAKATFDHRDNYGAVYVQHCQDVSNQAIRLINRHSCVPMIEHTEDAEQFARTLLKKLPLSYRQVMLRQMNATAARLCAESKKLFDETRQHIDANPILDWVEIRRRLILAAALIEQSRWVRE